MDGMAGLGGGWPDQMDGALILITAIHRRLAVFG